MGAYQNNASTERKSRSKRGSTNNTGRLEAFRKGGEGGRGDWATADSKRIQAVVVAITALGGAITFGLSRDGGAHSVTLLLDQSRETLWFNGDEDLDEKLDEVAATLQSIAVTS